jgi:hypothetical protein
MPNTIVRPQSRFYLGEWHMNWDRDLLNGLHRPATAGDAEFVAGGRWTRDWSGETWINAGGYPTGSNHG